MMHFGHLPICLESDEVLAFIMSLILKCMRTDVRFMHEKSELYLPSLYWATPLIFIYGWRFLKIWWCHFFCFSKINTS